MAAWGRLAAVGLLGVGMSWGCIRDSEEARPAEAPAVDSVGGSGQAGETQLDPGFQNQETGMSAYPGTVPLPIDDPGTGGSGQAGGTSTLPPEFIQPGPQSLDPAYGGSGLYGADKRDGGTGSMGGTDPTTPAIGADPKGRDGGTGGSGAPTGMQGGYNSSGSGSMSTGSQGTRGTTPETGGTGGTGFDTDDAPAELGFPATPGKDGGK